MHFNMLLMETVKILLHLVSIFYLSIFVFILHTHIRYLDRSFGVNMYLL